MISVHPGIFFSSTEETSFLWRRIKVRVDHYYDRTYADRLNHVLDIPLQNTFAFLRADDEDWTDDLDLKSLLANIKIGEREGPSEPPFYRFADIDLDRNVKMTRRTATDTAFANTIINVWKMFGSQDGPPPDKAGTSSYFLKDLEKFRSRGGQVILVRFPSSGGLKEGEGMAFPREDFWQGIVDKAQAPSYHYDDYQQLNGFFCPEWSHLSAEDAYTFTSELARIIQKDKVLK